MLAISSIAHLVSFMILDKNIPAIDENIEFASSKYCSTAFFHPVKISSSSVRLLPK
jgi:hypothetical protein